MGRAAPTTRRRQSTGISAACVFLTLSILVLPAHGQQLANRVAKQVKENLASLPDYTCELTIDRWRADRPPTRFRHRDRVRLEIAYLDGEELFSFRGANAFSDQPLRALVPEGAISKGTYALHLHNVFLSGSAEIDYEGVAEKSGIECHRFSYRLDGVLAGLEVAVNGKRELVGYEGSFWVAKDSLDLVYLEASLDSAPPGLGLSATREGITYRRTNIGKSSFVLPSRTGMTMELENEVTLHNETAYTNCQQYSGQSTISFGPPAAVSEPTLASPGDIARAASLAAARGTREVEPPRGRQLELLTETPIRGETTAVGDAIRAVVREAVKEKGKVVIPEGAIATLRVLQLEEDPNRRRSAVRLARASGRRELKAAYRLRLQLEKVQFGAARMTLDGDLQRIALHDKDGPLVIVEPEWVVGRTSHRIDRARGEFYVVSDGDDFVLPSGTVIVWKTS